MKKLLEFLLQNIVDKGEFEIEETTEDDREILNIKADKSVIGLIIGKDGQTIKNLRRILSIKGTLEGKLINISVSEA
jgi:predicted RNA-binding protein YlqC (UPF0109 family)